MSRNNPIEVIFNFIAKNPPMACIVGGIFFITLYTAIYLATKDLLTCSPLGGFGVLLIAIGILLHLRWLER